jgi:hypothetical protein
MIMKMIQLIGILLFSIAVNLSYAFETPIPLKNNDLQVINAAIEHPDGSAYFFVGKYFHQYDTRAGKLKRMGKIGRDAWYGVPANVDAAIVHPHNRKGYFFKGNMYYRYDFSKKKMDKRGILNVDGWKGLAGPIDAAIMHPKNNCAYFFKGNKYHRYNFSKKKVDRIGTIGVDAWKGFPANINATIMHSNGRAYGFKEDHYYRYVYGKEVDKKGVIGKDGWKVFHQIDAVVFNDRDNNLQTDNAHYIRGSYGYYTSTEYNNIGIIYFENTHKITKKRFGYDWYKGVPPSVDAGFLHPKNGRYYFFKGDKYYRYNPRTRKVDKIANIRQGFGISKVVAAVGIPETNNIYLFDGINYSLFNVQANKIVSSGTITSKFKGVPNWIDAATQGYQGIKFYKKDAVYVYSFTNRKVTRWGSLQPGLFK